MHIYDYIIIGSGLTGLTIAKKISEETQNILILEAQDAAGGDNRPATLNGHLLDNGLRFLPATEASRQAIGFLEELLGQTVTADSHENAVETYDASGFKRFLGFGDKSPEFYDQLSYFLSQEAFALTQTPYQWIQTLTENLKDKIQTRSIVTRFGFEGLDSEKPVLTHVMVNGTKQIYAKNFIFAGPVKELGLLVPDDVLNIRAKTKLKKSTAWQAVCVDLFHTAQTEKQNMFLLNGTTDDDIGPCIGRFMPTTEGVEGQMSQWMSFVDSEAAEDTENIGLVLKKIKRQIKRAFPEVSESVQKERIFVSPALSGADLKLNANRTLPKVENLWIASTQSSPYSNLLGSLMQSQLVLSALGFVTTTLPTVDTVDTSEVDA